MNPCFQIINSTENLQNSYDKKKMGIYKALLSIILYITYIEILKNNCFRINQSISYWEYHMDYH